LIFDTGSAFTATRPRPSALGDAKWTWPRLSVLGACCSVSRIVFGFSTSPACSAGFSFFGLSSGDAASVACVGSAFFFLASAGLVDRKVAPPNNTARSVMPQTGGTRRPGDVRE
jgi:hypothetical protein